MSAAGSARSLLAAMGRDLLFGAGPLRDHVDVAAARRSLPRSGQFHVSAASAVSPTSLSVPGENVLFVQLARNTPTIAFKQDLFAVRGRNLRDAPAVGDRLRYGAGNFFRLFTD
jgi:hypothetical protein